MPRRPRRKPLTKEQIAELNRKNRNFQARARYALKQKSLFYTEYEKLCKKYGCFVQCLYGAHITKEKRGEELYTIQSHLETVRRSIKD
jgi:hypothetical protein